MKAEFDWLWQKWRDATGGMSISRQKAQHPAYRIMVELGVKIIPCALQRLDQSPYNVAMLMGDITGAHPYPEAPNGSRELLVNSWKSWALENGYEVSATASTEEEE